MRVVPRIGMNVVTADGKSLGQVVNVCQEGVHVAPDNFFVPQAWIRRIDEDVYISPSRRQFRIPVEPNTIARR